MTKCSPPSSFWDAAAAWAAMVAGTPCVVPLSFSMDDAESLGAVLSALGSRFHLELAL
jgi:hypothetical protein